MLYALNVFNFICQMYLNKPGKNKSRGNKKITFFETIIVIIDSGEIHHAITIR